MQKIDVHGHLGCWNFPIPHTGRVEHLVTLCEKHEIAHLACSSVLAICYDMKAGNAELAAALAAYPQLWGYVYVNANYVRESVAEMERYLAQPGFVGVKIHAAYSGVNNNDARMQALMAEVAARARVVKIHSAGPEAPRTIADWAERYPTLQIIIAHALGNAYEEAARVARDYPNVHLEFCSSWAGAGKIRRALEICGARQILFGSDMDLLDPAFVLGQYENASLSPAEKQAIFWDNPRRLFGLTLT